MKILQKKLKNNKIKIQSCGEEDYGEYCQELAMNKDFENEKTQFLKSLQVTDEEKKDTKHKTVGQAENNNWFEARKNRLTASNFGSICKRLKTTKYGGPTVRRILYQDINDDLPALQYGRLNEPEAIRQYEKEKSVKVTPCGRFIDSEIGYLAATPDGLIEPNGIVEVKCPLSI